MATLQVTLKQPLEACGSTSDCFGRPRGTGHRSCPTCSAFAGRLTQSTSQKVLFICLCIVYKDSWKLHTVQGWQALGVYISCQQLSCRRSCCQTMNSCLDPVGNCHGTAGSHKLTVLCVPACLGVFYRKNGHVVVLLMQPSAKL